MRSLLIPLVCLSQLGATDCGSVIRDPGFDLWCGDSLCSWKSVRGEARRAATWHDGDTGVELVGADSAIQQISPVNASDGNCIRFSLLSDVEDNAEAFLSIDLQADGTVERMERIAGTHFEPSSYSILITPPYDGIRFELSKRGAGKAVLAQLHAEMSTECEGITPIASGPRPAGSSCSLPEECASGICAASPDAPPASFFGTACGGCDPAVPTSCGTGFVCGIGDALGPILAMPLDCVAREGKEIGEKCITGGECASGTCSRTDGSLGTCSACTYGSQCAGGACGAAWNDLSFDSPAGPYVCDPGQGVSPSGTACGTHADCASGVCDGPERKECLDGRPCNSPGDCSVDAGLAPGACTTVGVQGGSCR